MKNNITFLFRRENNQLFKEKYSSFLQTQRITHRYYLEMFDYRLEQSKYLSADESFIMLLDNKCVGAVFLPVETINAIKSVTLSGDYTLAPIFADIQFGKMLFGKINNICQNHDIQIVKFFIDTLLKAYTIKHNYLLDYGYVDCSSNDAIIDLTLDESRLWTNIRSSYKNLINKIIKADEYTVLYADHLHPRKELHDSYVDLHTRNSKNSRKNLTTYDMQYEMLLRNKGSVFVLLENNEPIGGIYCLHSQKTVSYASGAKIENAPINKAILHTLLWHVIQYYKSKNYEFLHLGLPCGYNTVDGFNNYYDDKQINISDFKRGMGAESVTLFRGINYLDKSLLAHDVENFKNKMLQTYNACVQDFNKTD